METKDIVRRYGTGFQEPSSMGEVELQQRFETLWGCKKAASGVWRVLKEAYSGTRRHFHTLRHIGECLQLADQYAAVVGWPELPPELELALWFHDVVYEPGAKDNESRSAELFQSLASETELAPDVVEGTTALILETKDHEARGALLSSVMCDCDLWILGSSAERYREYASQVRRENGGYSNAAYRWGRSRFLRKMLGQEKIYSNPLFEEEFGVSARMNLESELLELRASSSDLLLTKKNLPGLSNYFVLSLETRNPTADEEAAFFVAAHQRARELALLRYGNPGCYSLVYNAGGLRRRDWPHFHLLLARSRRQKRVLFALLWLKGPLAVLGRAFHWLGPAGDWRPGFPFPTEEGLGGLLAELRAKRQ